MEETFALELLKGYKRSNKILAIALFICLGIICLFVGGLLYFVTNYEFSYEDTTVTGDNNNYNQNVTGDINNGD